MLGIDKNKYIVLFDLDETIINCKSLFEVFKKYCIDNSPSHLAGLSIYNSIYNELKEMQIRGYSREEINKKFYTYFNGISRNQMKFIINEWFIQQCTRKNFFNYEVLVELERHQINNSEIVMVSGSFFDCVEVIAKYLDVKHIVCINLENINDVYTGNIEGIQTIGYGKIHAIRRYLSESKLHGQISYAYADHISDLHFLQLAKYPTAVGGTCPELLTLANHRNWKIIP